MRFAEGALRNHRLRLSQTPNIESFPKLLSLVLGGTNYRLPEIGKQAIKSVVAVGLENPVMPPVQVVGHRVLGLAL
ncbi:hypothetical protein, partial [Microvirga massiliensis]|uniref:hypothetical protein n=1 Tax=Microvirga massiliensis TaxID=1033741 RepID=UPI00062B929E